MPPVSPITRQFGAQGPLTAPQQQQQNLFQDEFVRRSRSPSGPGVFQRAANFGLTGDLQESETVGKTEKFFFTLLCIQYFALTYLTLMVNNAFKEDDVTYCYLDWSASDSTTYKFAVVWNSLFLTSVFMFAVYKAFKASRISAMTGQTSPKVYMYGGLALVALFGAISSFVMTSRVYNKEFETRFSTPDECCDCTPTPEPVVVDEDVAVEEENGAGNGDVVEGFKPITELQCAKFELDTDYQYFKVLIGFSWFLAVAVTLILLFDPIYRRSIFGMKPPGMYNMPSF